MDKNVKQPHTTTRITYQIQRRKDNATSYVMNANYPEVIYTTFEIHEAVELSQKLRKEFTDTEFRVVKKTKVITHEYHPWL
jgi:hypothetical protein